MSDPRAGDAGAAAAVPASSRPGGAARADLVPAGARTELDRIRRRWSELTVARADASAPRLRAVVDEIAARTAPGVEVSDLGPAVLVDQLVAVVWDAYAADRADGVGDTLTELRRSLP